MSQRELAELIHVSRTSISKIESDLQPISDRLIVSLCNTLDLDANWLLAIERPQVITQERFREISKIIKDLLME